MKKVANIFAVIGVIVTVAAAVAGIAYLVYRLVNKNCIESSECYEFDCSDCTAEDCECCPLTEIEDEEEAAE